VSDPTRDPMAELDALLARELGQAVPADPDRTARIMARVRASSSRSTRRWAAPHGSRVRRGWTSSAGMMALAAGVVGMIAGGALRPAARGAGPASAVTATVLDDTVASALRDTLRLVRFVLAAPTASRVTLVGDFNRWNARATPLLPERRRGVWSVAVALVPGDHRYAFVVDDTGWVTDPAAARTATDSGRPHSLLTVAGTRN
jgi:hypothetical protein